MPVRNGYNLVEEAAADLRVPLYDEEAFRHGITFQSKYVGSLNMPRPSSRVEIVAAMRRIRNEFKTKCIKKKKVSIVVSVDGVKVILWKNQKRKEWTWDESKLLVLHDPIYRIFYVSHDSRELRVFSYIARDGSSSSFRCNVFKSKKKVQAVRIVRTLGQAFEVSHQLSLQNAQQHLGESQSSEEELSGQQLTGAQEGVEDATRKGTLAGRPCDQAAREDPGSEELDMLKSSYDLKARDSQDWETFLLSMEGPQGDLSLTSNQAFQLPPLAAQHHLQLLQHQLHQQQLQMQVAVSQVQLLKEQLAAETQARTEAQAQVGQLLLQNRDLLQHVALLLQQLKDLEGKALDIIHSGESSPWGPVFSLSLRNSHCSERGQSFDSSPVGKPGKTSTPTLLEGCAESCFSLLSLGNEAHLDAPGEDKALVEAEVSQQVEGSDDSGGQIVKINTRTVRRVMEWFQQSVPRLNAPPSNAGRKKVDKTRFLGQPQPTCDIDGVSLGHRTSPPHAEPCDTYSLGNSENESCTTSEDSGVRCEKSALSPQHQAALKAQGPCLSASSSCSGQQEDSDGYSPTSMPVLSSCPAATPDSYECPFTSSSIASGI
ncbi:carboxyl-terminal PDZ ligand of neuronal nitric oxide synthase protein-like isoform X2 [Scleropages formosus]|uniref:Carboxyl-terminal PDZ ligand of neuronal nitric oxide synthase protein n=1 Tax=Scleropages formosus TaxID=113540 RepID=A0A8C9V1W3_SCLFO|nr:carboxyl-terminal PDZ ligand of neuronal nitric oxide synthase protein-like isoform X2 [Scleropages formosus]